MRDASLDADVRRIVASRWRNSVPAMDGDAIERALDSHVPTDAAGFVTESHIVIVRPTRITWFVARSGSEPRAMEFQVELSPQPRLGSVRRFSPSEGEVEAYLAGLAALCDCARDGTPQPKGASDVAEFVSHVAPSMLGGCGVVRESGVVQWTLARGVRWRGEYPNIQDLLPRWAASTFTEWFERRHASETSTSDVSVDLGVIVSSAQRCLSVGPPGWEEARLLEAVAWTTEATGAASHLGALDAMLQSLRERGDPEASCVIGPSIEESIHRLRSGTAPTSRSP